MNRWSARSILVCGRGKNLHFKIWLTEKHQPINLEAMKSIEILLENALDAVVGASSSGKVIYWNNQSIQLFGWSREEAMGSDVADLIVPERFKERHLAQMRHFLKSGEGPILNQRIEVPAVRKDGTEFMCELTVTPIHQDDSVTFFSFIRDITQVRQAEDERARLLKEAHEAAEQAKNAVQARDEFIGICSHELKTPLTALRMQFQMTERKLLDGQAEPTSIESTLKRVQTANRQLGRISRLIDDMFDISRISAGKMSLNREPFELTVLFDDLAQTFRFEITKPDSLVILGDRDRLEQVFVNLLSNAKKYGNAMGTKVVIEKTKECVQISIGDQGNGISPDQQSRIFEKFERGTGTSHVTGMGVGLFISRNIVELHGGSIGLKSKVGDGATFTVKLPQTF